MGYPAPIDLTILQGATFNYVLRWGIAPTVFVPITAATKAAPVSITATAHGIPDGWPVAITDVLGMTELNSKHAVPRASDFVIATVVDANTITIGTIDSKGYSTYSSGGIIRYATPVTLTGYTARMQVRSSVGSATVLLSLTSGSGITLSNSAKTITLLVSATDTAALTFTKGVYDLELVSSGGVVTRLAAGSITVSKEVTR